MMRERTTEKEEMLGHCKRIPLNSNFLTIRMTLVEF